MARSRVLLGLFGLAFFAGQDAEAQLFPNMWIRRQRPDASTESPIIKMHRDHYYGYHPTDWGRFPAGWGITSPEEINREELMQQVMKEVKELDEEFGPNGKDRDRDRDRGGDDDIPPRAGAGGRGRDDGAEGAIPRPVPLPTETDSPFNLDNKPAAVKPDLDTKPRVAPPAVPELPKAGDSPFDLPPEKPAAAPASDGIPPRPRTGTGSGTGTGTGTPTQPRTGFINDLDSGDVAAVEAPPEVMRAPERNPLRDTLTSLNPRSWVRRR